MSDETATKVVEKLDVRKNRLRKLRKEIDDTPEATKRLIATTLRKKLKDKNGEQDEQKGDEGDNTEEKCP